MKNIFFLLAMMLIIASCTKEADMNMATDPEYTVKKNLYRVKKIEGHNEQWGDYILLLNYENEQLRSGFRVDVEGDTVGSISIGGESNTRLEIELNDFVPNIDSDSISRLDNALKEKYGEGNYSLKDSIPLAARELLTQVIYLYDDGRINKQIVTYYTPREDVGVGEDFDNSYILTRRTTNVYEYNTDGNICVNRMFDDMYDPEDPYQETYSRSLYKYEIAYEEGQIASMVYLTANAGENYTELDRYVYNYSNGLLQSLQGNDLKIEFVYNGSVLASATQGNVQYAYQFDANGNVTEINAGNGNYMKLSYEEGNGNFSLFTPVAEQMLGLPYPK